MSRLAACLALGAFFGALTVPGVAAFAQAGATPPAAAVPLPGQPPTAADICRTLEAAAAENALPVEFFARVIWQESRFDALAVSRKGAEGIAQFMPPRPIGGDWPIRLIRSRR